MNWNQIAADDVFGTFLKRPRHLDDIRQDDIGHHTYRESYHPEGSQMHVGLPLPSIQSEGLEDGQRHHHKRGADNPCRNRFYTSLFHFN